MTAEKLRDAADSLRAHPLTVHPKIADALARWLDDVAAGWVWDDGIEVMTHDGDILALNESMDSHALTIADLLLGTTPARVPTTPEPETKPVADPATEPDRRAS